MSGRTSPGASFDDAPEYEVMVRGPRKVERSLTGIRRRDGRGAGVTRVFERLLGIDRHDLYTIGPGSPVVLVRMTVIGLIAIAATFEPLEHRTAVMGVLLTAIAVQPLIAMIPGRAPHTWQRFFAGDLAAGTAIALLEPEVEIRYLILVVGLIGAAASCYRVVGFIVYTVIALTGLATVLLVHDVEEWGQKLIAAGIIGSAFGAWMLRSRMIADATAEDFQLAVDGADGVFMHGFVGDPVVRIIGDAEALFGRLPLSGGWMNLREHVHPDDIDDYWLPDDSLVDGAEIERTVRFMSGDGSWRWLRETTQVVERGGRLQLRGVMLDHTAHIDGLTKAKFEAATDSLTGLANRRVLVRLLDRSEVPGRHVVLLDLDAFKRVNDTLGHDAGDELLCVVAARIGARIREGDLLVRLGGDEFAIVLDDVGGTHDAVAQVDRLLAALGEPISLNGVVVNTTASAGLVCEEAGASGSTTILRRADLAMYEAKRHGLGLVVFTPALEGERERRSELVRDLPAALANGDLRLLFQPILDATGRNVIAAEGLARWMHPQFGALAPAVFLDVVLVSSQSGAFTRRMVERALDFVISLRPHGALKVAVNLPINTIEDESFARWFFERCDRTGVDPSSIVFEMSERDLHGDDRTASAVSQLSSRGVTISIDDFGTGHSTFDRLAWRDVSQLKIDRSLVQRAVDVERDEAILRHVVRLAKDLGYEVVGEGVESEAHRALLAAIGVDAVQGFHFSTALEVDDFVEYLQQVAAAAPTTSPRPV